MEKVSQWRQLVTSSLAGRGAGVGRHGRPTLLTDALVQAREDKEPLDLSPETAVRVVNLCGHMIVSGTGFAGQSREAVLDALILLLRSEAGQGELDRLAPHGSICSRAPSPTDAVSGSKRPPTGSPKPSRSSTTSP